MVYPGGLVLLLGAGWLANHKENPTQTPSNWLHFAFRVYGYWAAAAPGEGAPGLYPGPAPPPQAEPPLPPPAVRAARTSWNLLRLTGHLKSRLKLYKKIIRMIGKPVNPTTAKARLKSQTIKYKQLHVASLDIK